MTVSTVDIPIQAEFVAQLDQIAAVEFRTRADLVNNAVKIYIDRKNEWKNIFKTGQQIGSTLALTEEDVIDEIKAYRKTKNTN